MSYFYSKWVERASIMAFTILFNCVSGHAVKAQQTLETTTKCSHALVSQARNGRRNSMIAIGSVNPPHLEHGYPTFKFLNGIYLLIVNNMVVWIVFTTWPYPLLFFRNTQHAEQILTTIFLQPWSLLLSIVAMVDLKCSRYPPWVVWVCSCAKNRYMCAPYITN